ncbi:MAG: beta-ketoacyl synthase chain length factor [Thermodesulfobacteriota bacterium]
MKAIVTRATHISQEEIDLPPELLRHLRRADDFIKLGVLAAFGALEGKTAIPWENPQRCGLFLGSSFGPMETNFAVLDQIVGGQQTSPTLFSHSVFNAAVGYLCRIFNLRGSALTLTDFALPFCQALQQGALAIESGLLERCLVLQVETYSALLNDARRKISPGEAGTWPEGAVCWLLEREDLCQTGGPVLHAVDIAETQGGSYLESGGQLSHNGQEITFNHPLAPAALLTDILNSKKDSGDWRLITPYARVDISLRDPK